MVVINTCGFIDSAKEEAIDTILSVAALKAEGQVQKILVTGCLTQRYQQEILTELPEVDGIMGTGSYGEIVPALAELMAGGRPCRFADIHGMIDEFDRVLTTPGHYAYLRIAEGCDNRCAYCVIPSLRGRYRSRRMEDVLAEARKLSDAGSGSASSSLRTSPVTASTCTESGSWRRCCGSCARWISAGSACTICTPMSSPMN